jgi:hypothetical protein
MTDDSVVLVILAVRLAVPLLIPRFPLPSILVCLVVDAADQTVLQNHTDLPLDNYQGYDKALDIYYLSVAYLSTIRNWTDDFAHRVAAALWYYRLVGVVAFELTDTRWLLLVFPNTFEYVFIAYEAVRLRWDPRRLTHRHVLALTAAIWVFIKLPQEWWIHVAQNDFTDILKGDVLGVPLDSTWADALGQNLWFVALLVAVGAGLVVGWRRLRTRLPAPDWSTTFAVDRHLPPVGELSTAPIRLWSARTGERVALVALICVIFASVLPDVDRGPVQTALGVGLLVIANAVVSQWLVGRGVRWRSNTTQFLGMAAVNAAVLWAFGALGRSSNEDLNGPSLLFFGLLITLLVTLFDRYQDVRQTRPVDSGDRAATPSTSSTTSARRASRSGS